jgi:hypothetical protein
VLGKVFLSVFAFIALPSQIKFQCCQTVVIYGAHGPTPFVQKRPVPALYFAVALFIPQDLDLLFPGVNQYVLRFTSTYAISFQRAFVIISSFFHFRNQLLMPVKKSPEFSAPPYDFRVIAVAPFIFC